MGLLSRCGLMALLGASAVLASPFVDELILPRATSKCPSAYTSKNGLNFTTYCEQNNPWNDAMDPFATDSMEDCMEHCSRYWGNGEGCFGVVWREDKQCWIRNSTTSTKNLVNDTGIHAALIDRSQMKAQDTACPAADLSVHTFASAPGIGYTVNCNKVISGFDTCWHSYPSCNANPFQAFYHATSLDDCLAYCVKESPLCRAAVYNPGMEIGFANCWPKTGFDTSLVTPNDSMGVVHTVTITSIDTIDTKCPSADTYTAASGRKNFQIHCGQLNSGTNITAVHTQNITACMDACSQSTQGCVAVVFDSSLQGGYMNCYLQNTTSVITNQASATYAVVAGAASSTAPALSSSSSSSSKAWIAGPVIGGLAALALIGAAVWWFRRRKSAGAAADRAAAGAGAGEKDGAYGAYGAQDGTSYAPVPQYAAPPSELGSSPAHEMEGSVKYAHAKATQQGPSELPS